MVTDGPGDVITGRGERGCWEERVWAGGGGGAQGGKGVGGVRGREAMPPITIIFHHPNYIVECVSAVACAHPVLLLGKERGRET